MEIKNSFKIYNSLTRSLEDFKPLNPPKVTMYVCGPTVYDLLHVGNFRGPVVYNLMRNWLEYLGYQVEFALNFTDVDDKILQRAKTLNVNPQSHSEKYIQEYKKDFKSLGLHWHDHNPKVTETMPEIIQFVGKLIETQKAYVVEKEKNQKDVLYSIESFSEYGKLSGRKTDELQAGARVEVDESKKNPMDFALWKGAKPEEESSWSSPWGLGRPGWHIECSAMIHKIFGDQIDIHGGGTDLIFPHHENEIAQSEGLSGKKFVQYWVHVSMLNFAGQKMSKSLGNLVTLREFLEKNHPEIYKYMILSSHYRSVSEFSEVTQHQAISALARIYSVLSRAARVRLISEETPFSMGLLEFQNKIDEKIKNLEVQKSKDLFYISLKKSLDQIISSLNEDFGTPAALAVVFDLVRQFNTEFPPGLALSADKSEKVGYYYELIRTFGKILSLFQEPSHKFLKDLDDLLLKRLNLERSYVDQLVLERVEARKAKDYKRSDELRDQLNSLGVSVMDSAEGTLWEVIK